MEKIIGIVIILIALMAADFAAYETKDTTAIAPAVADTTVHPVGMKLEWTYFIGGNNFETVKTRTPVLDRDGMLWFLGETASKDFPTTPDALQAKHQGGQDAVLLAFNVADNSLAYGSYLGGSKNEDMPLLAFDENGALYVIGTTNSDDFPTLEKSPASRKEMDIFISKFSVRNDPAKEKP